MILSSRYVFGIRCTFLLEASFKISSLFLGTSSGFFDINLARSSKTSFGILFEAVVLVVVVFAASIVSFFAFFLILALFGLSIVFCLLPSLLLIDSMIETIKPS